MRPHHPRSGFTLVELLTVIAIMAVLATMVLVVAKDFFQADKARTGAIVATVSQAMELAKAQTGSAPSPAEHPLAGSRAPRFKFITKEGGSLAANGRALKGRPRTFYTPTRTYRLVTSQGEQRLLDPDDIYADDRVPMLFGVKRRYFGILGAQQAAVTHFVRLKSVDLNQLRNAEEGTITITPLDDLSPEIASNIDQYEVPNSTDMSDFRNANKQDGTLLLPLGNKVVIDQVLNATALQGELAKLKALSSSYMSKPPGGYPATEQEKAFVQDLKDIKRNPYSEVEKTYTTKFGSTGLTLPLVLFPATGVVLGGKDSDNDDTKWKPGWIKVAGRWKPYRLPGLSIIDAWGREILINYSATGRLMVMSAGKDGVLRWNPGQNLIIDTAARDIVPKGDDKDGRTDNIGNAKVEDD